MNIFDIKKSDFKDVPNQILFVDFGRRNNG